MRANSPSAYFVSLLLHGTVVALLFALTYVLTQREEIKPVIFELVAGDPTAPNELVAPALGNTTLKLTVPVVAPPKVVPVVEPVVEPVPEPPKPEVKKPEPVKPTPQKIEPPKPEPKKPVPVAPPPKVSYQEFQKSNPLPKTTPTPPPRKPIAVPKVDVQGIAGGVRAGSTTNTKGGGGGTALAREEQSLLDTYISLLIQELKKAHEPPSGVSDRLAADVTFDITANGTILRPRISRSSGDRVFDESVLDAFRRVRPIGPTPNRQAATWTVTFKMRDDG